ncbi:MAG: DUF3857 domain-containing protein [Saprospiraceae bacterium]
MKIRYLIIVLILFSIQLFGQKTNNTTIFEPVPSWVKTYPKPKLKAEYDLSLVRVHKETQYNQITGENYNRFFFYINDVNGINKLSTFSEYYEPAYQAFHLHKIAIHQGEKATVLTNELHTETIHFDEKIGTTQYDDDAKFIIHFDRLKVGDLVEISYSIKGKQPDLGNFLFYRNNIEGKDFVGINYDRILGYPDKAIHYTLLNSDEKPTIKKNANYTELELITTAQETFNETEKHWFIPHKKLYVSDMSSWNDLVKLDLKNHQLEIPPSKSIQNKVNLLTKGIKQKDEKIIKIFDFIQRDIEYLEYDLIEPKRPEVTLNKGYGDCKSMSLLTIKMLECIDVDAYPVVVNSKGIDDRLIHSKAFIFDHEVIEFIYENDTILFDATMNFKEGKSYKRAVSDFRYGLRTIEGSNKLTRFSHQTAGKIVYNETRKVKRNYDDELEYYSDKTVIFEGNLAAKMHELKEDFNLRIMWEDGVKDYYSNTWCAASEGFHQDFSYDEFIPKFTITVDNQMCHSYQIYSSENDDILKLFPDLLKSWWHSFEAQKSSRLFEILPFNDVTFNYKIVLEDSISIKSDSIFIKNDWLEYKQVIEKKGNIIYATYHIKTLKPYLPNQRFKEVKSVIEQIQNDMVIYIDKRYLPKESKWKNSKNYIPFFMIGLFLTFIATVWWIIRTLRKRKKRIIELETEVEELKGQLS